MTKHGSDEMVKSAENCHGADVAAKQRWASEAPSKKSLRNPRIEIPRGPAGGGQKR